MVRALWNSISLGTALALTTAGCSSAPKYNEPYAQTAKPAPSSWTDSLTAPFKSSGSQVAKDGPKNDPTSLNSPNPKPNAELCVAAANVYEKSNNARAAVGEYEKALKLDPQFSPALLGYAHLLDRQGSMTEATNFYQRAVAADPKNATAHNDLGICLARQGALDASLSELSRAVSLQPDKKLYRNNLAQLQVEQGRVNEAFVNLQAAHGDAVAHYNLAYLLQQKGDTEAASEHLSLALRLDPNMTAAQNLLAQISGRRGGSISQVPALPASYSNVSSSPLPVITGSPSPVVTSSATSWQTSSSNDTSSPAPARWESSAPSFPASDEGPSLPIRSEYVPSRSVLPDAGFIPPTPDQISQ